MEIKNERQFTLKRIALLKNFKNKVLRKQRKMPFPEAYKQLEKIISDLIDFEVKTYLIEKQPHKNETVFANIRINNLETISKNMDIIRTCLENTPQQHCKKRIDKGNW